MASGRAEVGTVCARKIFSSHPAIKKHRKFMRIHWLARCHASVLDAPALDGEPFEGLEDDRFDEEADQYHAGEAGEDLVGV